MGKQFKPIYGSKQYPHIDLLFSDNPDMDISERIARTLTIWMDAREDLGTIKKLSAKSKVGFGTVQRAKNGDGNITVKNLALIARAFGRPVEALLDVPAAVLPALPPPILLPRCEVREPDARYADPTITELLDLANTMDSTGLNLLLVVARALAAEHPNDQRAAG